MRSRRALTAVIVGAVLLLSTLTTLIVFRGPSAAWPWDADQPAGSDGMLGHSGPVSVVVDNRGQGSAISPLIYGVAFADERTLRALGATVDRWGGNASTRYNWTASSENAARDWEFRNKPGNDPDAFVAGARAAGASVVMTVPTIGWVARNSDNGTRSVGVPAGGGRALNAAGAIAGYDPARNRSVTSVPSLARRTAGGPAGAVYQDDFVRHVAGRTAGAGAALFAMDNEPDLWSVTHTDVHPADMSYEDMLRNYLEYSSAVKDADPRGTVLAPELCCWSSLWYSALDRGQDNFRSHPDQSAHAGVPFMEWWLRQVAAADAKAGRRSLGMVSLHFYPQAEGVYSDRSDAATRALRVSSTRSLWDPAYTDPSWIRDQVRLLPRLKQWIHDAYPGTGLAITEYSFGGEHDASGAVAQAEALGIFGREGVTMAATWTHPSPSTPQGAAFRLFRNYDGAGAAFGDASLPVRGAGTVAAYAARHTGTGEVDVVVVNESLDAPATVTVSGRESLGTQQARYLLAPGSAEIEAVGAAPTTTLPPLGMALLRFRR